MRCLITKSVASLVLLVAALVPTAITPASAVAGNWIFAPSYYSHAPIFQVEIGTPTRTRTTAPQYFQSFVQGGYRATGGSYNLRSNNYNYGRYFESWTQGGPHN